LSFHFEIARPLKAVYGSSPDVTILRCVGFQFLLDDDLSVPINKTAIHCVATCDRGDLRILLQYVLAFQGHTKIFDRVDRGE